MSTKWEVKDTFLIVKHNIYKKPKGVQYSMVTFCPWGTVVIVAVNKAGRLILIKQFRPAAEKEFVNLPGGRIKEGQTPEMAARAELIEESGFIAKKFELISEVFSNPTRITDKCAIFFAKDAYKKSNKRSTEIAEKKIKINLLKITDVLKMIRSGGIEDTTSIAAILLAKEKGLLNNYKI